MKMGRLSVYFFAAGLLLTLVNLAFLVFLVSRGRTADLSGTRSVLRAQQFELVDGEGRVRAQLMITQPITMPDGKTYAEGVLFRLIDQNGRPGVKIGTSPDGSGMSLAGDSEKTEWSGIQLLADGTGSMMILTNKDGQVQQIKP
jgi:hypothetical protein